MEFKNILVFRAGQLGDTIVSIPAFWAIRKAFPNAKMTLLSGVNPSKPNYVAAKNVLPKDSLFNDYLTYPTDGEFSTLFRNSVKILFELRKRKYDAVFYMMARHRTLKHIRRDKIIFRFAGIKNVVGTKYFEQNILDYSETPLPYIERESDFFLKCLEFENIPIPSDLLSLEDFSLNQEEKNTAEKWLEENCQGISNNQTFVAVAPASKWESKTWAEDRFAEVIGKLIEQKQIFPIIFGGPEDREKGERLLKIWKTGANAAGQLNIRQAAAALSKCKLFIGNDSGTMHIAATVGVTCIGIFSAIDYPGRWVPFGKNNIAFRERVDCEGCLLNVCPRKNECLEKIPVDKVFQASLEKLENV
jgi:ADP-heptose:LPS heptosyltransferase